MAQSYLHIFHQSYTNQNSVNYLKERYRWPGRVDAYDGSQLGVKQLRSYFLSASKKPLDNMDMFLIITQAELVSLEVANTMLKILEEPPPYLHIHLLTGNEGQVLPTIISRCHRVRHNWSQSQELGQWQWEDMNIAQRMKWAQELSSDEDISLELANWLEREVRQKNWKLASRIEKLLSVVNRASANKKLLLENFALQDFLSR